MVKLCEKFESKKTGIFTPRPRGVKLHHSISGVAFAGEDSLALFSSQKNPDRGTRQTAWRRGRPRAWEPKSRQSMVATANPPPRGGGVAPPPSQAKLAPFLLFTAQTYGPLSCFFSFLCTRFPNLLAPPPPHGCCLCEYMAPTQS